MACAMLRDGTLFNPEAARRLPRYLIISDRRGHSDPLVKRWGVPSITLPNRRHPDVLVSMSLLEHPKVLNRDRHHD
ncbi:hypothetical protein DC522_31290 [Microvirga sp. KLBC 81]|nr:hypothetical protein DC522_31290 [Microvirga sp. KLBC 81]